MGIALIAEIDQVTLAIIAGVGLATLGVVYFGVRYWLASTRPTALQDVKTPNIDRLNHRALERMAGETLEEDEAETQALQDEDSPPDLKAIISPDPETKQNAKQNP